MFLFFVNELAVEVSRNGTHGIHMSTGAIEISLLLLWHLTITLSSRKKKIELDFFKRFALQNSDVLILIAVGGPFDTLKNKQSKKLI